MEKYAHTMTLKKEVLKVHKNYNKNYLQAEYQTAKASGQMIRKWDEIQEQKEIYPNLEYRTVGDSHVRDEHQLLNGVIKPIDDTFWDSHYPPNGFRCRCTIRSTDSPVTTQKVNVKIDKGFKHHVGKTKEAFNKAAHPYFAIPEKDQEASKIAFELSKLNAKLTKRYTAKNGAKVRVSPFTNSKEATLTANYKTAITLAKKQGVNVDLTAQLDSSIIKNRNNTEYLINDKIGTRKVPGTSSYKNSLKKASNQKSEVVVIDLSKNKDSVENASTQIQKELKNKSAHPHIKEVYIISKDAQNVKHIKR
ncbi:phage minor head protein [Tenacibaculum maritimum]|nr:phage minor head protein [Tenacibaculum maritimum]